MFRWTVCGITKFAYMFLECKRTWGYRRDGDAVTNTNNEGKLFSNIVHFDRNACCSCIVIKMNKTVRKFM